MIPLLILRAWGALRRDPALLAVVALALTVAVLAGAVHYERGVVATEHLAALNADAARDTSEALRGVQATQLATATRLMVQQTVRADTLERRVHLTPIARTTVEIRMPPTTIHATADSARRTDNGRLIAFDLRSVPYTAHADVAVPDDTTQAPTIRLGIALDPAELTARVGCVGDTARVLFSAPPWLPLHVTGAEQDPRVCQRIAPALAPASHGRRTAALLTVAAILGAVLHQNVPAWIGHARRAPRAALSPLRLPLAPLYR